MGSRMKNAKVFQGDQARLCNTAYSVIRNRGDFAQTLRFETARRQCRGCCVTGGVIGGSISLHSAAAAFDCRKHFIFLAH